MTFVIDASTIAAALLPDENHPTAAEHLAAAARGGAYAPAIFPLELINTLIVSVRRKRIDVDYLHAALGKARRISISIDTIDMLKASDGIIEIAMRLGLTAYDAAYLELAQRRRIPLATLDSRLAQAARDAGVALL